MRDLTRINQLQASTEPHSCECGELLGAGLLTNDRNRASTEPHSCECGELHDVAHVSGHRASFNGAALV